MTSDSNPLVWILPIVAVTLILAIVGYVVVAGGRVPDGPAELVWDKTACAECRMHVGEPSFAAQIRTDDGAVLAFDDPGCLFRMLPELEGRVHGAWFHHVREDRWIPKRDVAFVEVEPTPMGYGLGAVEAGPPDALTFAEARDRVTAIEEGR